MPIANCPTGAVKSADHMKRSKPAKPARSVDELARHVQQAASTDEFSKRLHQAAMELVAERLSPLTDEIRATEARRAAGKKNAAHRALRAELLAWYAMNHLRFKSKDAAAEAWVASKGGDGVTVEAEGKAIRLNEGTARNWLKGS